MSANYLKPDWPAPAHVHAFTTTRRGGVSQAPYSALNLADHVGDSPQSVAQNRHLLVEQLQLPSPPYWLNQVHGSVVVEVDEANKPATADASFSDKKASVCAVMTADCLPVLFCDMAGRCVAAAHAGWRGLAVGVLEATVSAMPVTPARLLAWLGPAIGSEAFEVGDDVRQVFLDRHRAADFCFQPVSKGKWLADIYGLARLRLETAGVTRIYGGGLCTFQEAQRFYSYRRDGVTGRMVSMIWMD